MANRLQITAFYASDDKKKVQGYVDAPDVRTLRNQLRDQRFLELYDEDGKTEAWVNLDHVVKVQQPGPEPRAWVMGS